MFHHTTLPNGPPCAIVVRQHQIDRMQDKCFRLNGEAAAGNFSQWQTPEQVFEHDGLKALFLEEVAEHIREFGGRRHIEQTGSFTLSVPGEFIGWSSTAPRSDYAAADLKEGDLNRRATALFVREDRQDLKAPRTNAVTFVYELKYELVYGGWIIVVQSMYPGSDVGELKGNVSEREGIAFLGFSHPGE